MEKLSNYMIEHSLTHRQLAERAGMSPSFLSEILSSETRKSPSLEMAQRIEAATNGAVSVLDWPRFRDVMNAVHGIKPVNANGHIQDVNEKLTKS